MAFLCTSDFFDASGSSPYRKSLFLPLDNASTDYWKRLINLVKTIINHYQINLEIQLLYVIAVLRSEHYWLQADVYLILIFLCVGGDTLLALEKRDSSTQIYLYGLAPKFL